MKLKTTVIHRDGLIGLKFALPVPRPSRERVHVALSQLKQCVIPLIGANKRGRPYVEGSAVLVQHQGQILLVTAEHVIRGRASLYSFDSRGYLAQLNPKFLADEKMDLAVAALSREERTIFAHRPAIQSTELEPITVSPLSHYASTVGYPASRAKLINRVYFDAPLSVISHMAIVAPPGKVRMAFDKKAGMSAADTGDHITPCDPYAMSGGGMFMIPMDGWNVSDQPPRLAGVVTDWKRKARAIEAVSTASLLRLCEALPG